MFEIFMDRFVKKDLLGYGTYSMVYKGYDIMSGEVVALKIIKLSEDEGMPNTALREISLMKKLLHPNVLALFDVIHTETQLTLVLEYADADLRKVLTSESNIDRVGLIKQLIEGVAYLHRQQVIHRDLKPQNILVDKNGVLKIADFGLARSFEIKMPAYSSEVITLWYRPPELLKGCKVYGYSVDIWSVGCIVSEILTSTPLFAGTDKNDQIKKISTYLEKEKLYRMEWLLSIHKRKEARILGLIFECLRGHSEKRITASEAVAYISENKQ